MKAWELGDRQGSVDSLRLVERPDPVPAAGEALVRIRASALNYRDHMILNLIDSAPKPAHRIPLSDGAGEVVAGGAGVDAVRPGERVMVSLFTGWLDGPLQPHYFGTDLGGGCDGTLAELAAFPASSLVAIPDSLSDEEAACLPCAALTAWVSLVEFGQMKAGDTVLLLGTGGVSIFGLQLARMMGADAVITSSSDEKLARARALGASHGINYRRDPAWGGSVAELTGGADLIIETGGAATLAQSIEAAAFNARIALIGMLGGRRHPERPPRPHLEEHPSQGRPGGQPARPRGDDEGGCAQRAQAGDRPAFLLRRGARRLPPHGVRRALRQDRDRPRLEPAT